MPVMIARLFDGRLRPTAVAAMLCTALWGPFVTNVETPEYEIFNSDKNIEIRDYAKMIVAETEVSGERDVAIRRGFRIIADYIFGNNLSAKKVAMTAPVTQQASEKIAMTAPVTQQGDENLWKVRFVMPACYTLETLPKPKNPAVKLKKVEAKRFAAIRFSGFASQNNLLRHMQKLEDFIQENKLTAISAPTYAFYNPPWTLPFLRRNEMMIEIAR